MSSNNKQTVLLRPGGCAPFGFKTTKIKTDCESQTITLTQIDNKGEEDVVVGPHCFKPVLDMINDCDGSGSEQWLVTDVSCPDDKTIQITRVEAPFSDCLTSNGSLGARSNLELEDALPLAHNPDNLPVTEFEEVGFSLSFTNPLSCRTVRACYEIHGVGAYVRFDNPKVTDYQVPFEQVERHYGAYYMAISHQFQVNGGGFTQFSYDNRDIILAIDEDKPLLRTSDMINQPYHIHCETLAPGETVTLDYRALGSWTGPTGADGSYVGNLDFEARALLRDRSFVKLNLESI